MLTKSFAPAVASVAGFYLLSYVPHFLKGYFILKTGEKIDNNDPRNQLAKLEKQKVDSSLVSLKKNRKVKLILINFYKKISLIKRCQAAHNNSLENFAPFASAVALAMLRSA